MENEKVITKNGERYEILPCLQANKLATRKLGQKQRTLLFMVQQ